MCCFFAGAADLGGAVLRRERGHHDDGDALVFSFVLLGRDGEQQRAEEGPSLATEGQALLTLEGALLRSDQGLSPLLQEGRRLADDGDGRIHLQGGKHSRAALIGSLPFPFFF